MSSRDEQHPGHLPDSAVLIALPSTQPYPSLEGGDRPPRVIMASDRQSDSATVTAPTAAATGG